MDRWKACSEIFNNVTIGLAAIVGTGWGVVKGASEFFKLRRRDSYRNSIKKLYPREQINKTFKIVDYEKAPGKLYLVNLNRKEKYWIQSSATLLDLGFFWDDATRISIEEFLRYKEGPGILTTGSPGS